jgi:hypothetical protein
MVMMLVLCAGLCTVCCCMLPLLLAVGQQQQQQHVQWLAKAAHARSWDATKIMSAGATVWLHRWCHSGFSHMRSAVALDTSRGGSMLQPANMLPRRTAVLPDWYS